MKKITIFNSVYGLRIPLRVKKALKDQGIDRILVLCLKQKKELLKISGIGRKGTSEIEYELQKLNLDFDMSHYDIHRVCRETAQDRVIRLKSNINFLNAQIDSIKDGIDAFKDEIDALVHMYGANADVEVSSQENDSN